jgi:hypothetical protein
MDETLIKRLESAVTRLEALSTGIHPSSSLSDGSDASSDPSVVAFGDLIDQYVGRLSKAAEIIGGQVLDVTNGVKEAFSVQKELLIKLKQTQVRCFLCRYLILFIFVLDSWICISHVTLTIIMTLHLRVIVCFVELDRYFGNGGGIESNTD